MKKTLSVVPYPNKVEWLGGYLVSSADELLKTQIGRDSLLPEDGYRLTVSADGITAAAGGDAGEFYARQSLIQLCASESIPCCTVTDSPAYIHRGFMLDSARHMLPINEIKKIIDAMALIKMNVFHWHLSDDQGWRIQIDKYPLLTELASRRSRSDFGGEVTSGEYGGYYTKQEIREVVAYCSERFITVVPEIDLPGHTTCAIAAYPSLSCRGKAVSVATNSGIYSDILCMGKDETLNFVFDVLGEVADLFPGSYFHIGGDEAPKKRWKECPLCQERMHRLALDNEEQLQGWFSNEVADFLKKKGKTTIIYNDGLYSGMIKDDVIAHRWLDSDNFTSAFANRGGKVIMSDYHSVYLDYAYGLLPLKKVYGYRLTPPELLPENRKNIIGVEAPMWTEYAPSFERVCYQVFPRLCAVAELGWTDKREYNDFKRRLKDFLPHLDRLGIRYAKRREWNPGFLARRSGEKTMRRRNAAAVHEDA